MIQYYNPNLTFYGLFKALIERDAEKNIIDHFQAYTGKKYVLITGSCRASLYLAYRSLGITNKIVATSPLTCFSAIQPILLADNQIEFIDIDKNTLNIDLTLINKQVINKIDAIQVIHHGGIPVNFIGIKDRLRNHNVKIIEDCAQSYGSRYENKNVGFEADVACYSLIKNLYGIGGGVFATNDYDVYIKAKMYLEELPVISGKLLLFRIVRNLLETYKKNRVISYLYNLLMSVRSRRTDQYSLKPDSNIYVKPNNVVFKLNSVQLKKSYKINNKVKNNASYMVNRLAEKKISYNNGFNEDCSFTKLFVYNPKIRTKEMLENLNKRGIEAKHLEQKHNTVYQERFDGFEYFNDSESLKKCVNYYSVHDSIISLPLHNTLLTDDIEFIITSLAN